MLVNAKVRKSKDALQSMFKPQLDQEQKSKKIIQ